MHIYRTPSSLRYIHPKQKLVTPPKDHLASLLYARAQRKETHNDDDAEFHALLHRALSSSFQHILFFFFEERTKHNTSSEQTQSESVRERFPETGANRQDGKLSHRGRFE